MEDLISRQSAAHRLGIHPNTFDHAAREAGLEKYRALGDSRVFYLRAEVEKINVIDVVRDKS